MHLQPLDGADVGRNGMAVRGGRVARVNGSAVHAQEGAGHATHRSKRYAMS